MTDGYEIYTDSVRVAFIVDREASVQLCRNKCHEGYEILFPISDAGSCNVEGITYELSAGSVLIISPLCHHVHSFPEDEAIKIHSLSFSKTALSDSVVELLDEVISKGELGCRFVDSDEVDRPFSEVFQRFKLAAELSSREKEVLLSALISEIIVFLSALDGNMPVERDGDLGARVARYLRDNFDRNICLDKLAARFFVSKYHLCRAFKKHTGTSVHSYINQKRIIFAKQLIESGESALDVADRVGFGDYSSFYRAYVKIIGNAPTKQK